MPGSLRNWLGLALVAFCALVVFAIGAAATVFFGFAWAVLIAVALVWLMSRGNLGQNGEGAYVVGAAGVLLIIGILVGLALRWVLS